MKHISIVLYNAALTVDWESLANVQSTENVLILICSKDSFAKLNDHDRRHITQAIAVDDFSYDKIEPIVAMILHRYHQEGDKANIANLSEFDMMKMAKLRDRFKRRYKIEGPGQDIIANFRDKLKMKAILESQGVRLPKYRKFDQDAFKSNPSKFIESIENYIEYPMFVKPTDSGGSIGTAFIKNREALTSWCEKAAEENQPYEIDEFIDGDLYHCDSVIQNGEIKFTFVSKYLHPNADARSGSVLATMTMNPELQEYKDLSDFAEATLSKFPILPDGFTHLEVFKNRKGEHIFLEVAARPPGAKAPEMYRIRTNGIDIRWLHLKLQLGYGIDAELAHLNNPSEWGPFASMFQLLRPANNGIVAKTHEPTFKSSNHETKWNIKAGDVVSPNQSILDTLVSTLFWNSNYENFLFDFNSLDQQRIVDITPIEISKSSLFSKPISSIKTDSIITQTTLTDRMYGKLHEIAAGIYNAPYHFAQWVVTDNNAYFPQNSVTLVSQTSTSFFNNKTICPTNGSHAGNVTAPPSVPTIGH